MSSTALFTAIKRIPRARLLCGPPPRPRQSVAALSTNHYVSVVGRRPRARTGHYHDAVDGRMSPISPPPRQNVGLSEPFQHEEKDLATYLAKTSLSPWVPVPEPVARKMLDLVCAGPQDVHVDLGSGDGRVNFLALDHYSVAESVGIDVDEAVVAVALARRAQRHSPPPNLQFVVADLLDTSHDCWEIVQRATIITMYFAEPALAKLRPILEQKLIGRVCKIITCGYQMPGWESSIDEVVLGTSFHLYEWGGSTTHALSPIDPAEDGDEASLFLGDDLLREQPQDLIVDAVQSKFPGANVVDRTAAGGGEHPLPPLPEDDYDDSVDDDWDVASDESEDEGKSKAV
jgi:hypothetical protein